VFRLAVLPDGVLVSASWDSSIKLWDPDTGACLATLSRHQVRAADLSCTLHDYVLTIVIGGDCRARCVR
jgi:WD40 repeat protein